MPKLYLHTRMTFAVETDSPTEIINDLNNNKQVLSILLAQSNGLFARFSFGNSDLHEGSIAITPTEEGVRCDVDMIATVLPRPQYSEAVLSDSAKWYARGLEFRHAEGYDSTANVSGGLPVENFPRMVRGEMKDDFYHRIDVTVKKSIRELKQSI